MKNIIRLGAVFLLAIGIQSCYYDNPPELSFECEDVSFNTHVQPMLNASCATSSCHDGTYAPDLTEGNAWNALRGGYINLINAEESVLIHELATGSMPPGQRFSQDNIDIIQCWIESGGLNN